MSSVVWHLPLEYVLDNPNVLEGDVDTVSPYYSTRDGWVFKSYFGNDYYVWVRSWQATHSSFGTVSGADGDHALDIEGSEEAKKAFFEKFSLTEFDYGDI